MYNVYSEKTMENLRNRISDFMRLSHIQQKKLFKIDIKSKLYVAQNI